MSWRVVLSEYNTADVFELMKFSDIMNFSQHCFSVQKQCKPHGQVVYCILLQNF